MAGLEVAYGRLYVTLFCGFLLRVEVGVWGRVFFGKWGVVLAGFDWDLF